MLGRILTLLLLLFLAVPAGTASAAPAGATPAGAWVRSDMVEARLVAAVRGTGTLAEVPLGLQVRLAPGWKTYWRSPGDAGQPPAIDWAASRNLASASIAWPAPERFTLFGLETFGYAGEVTFPIAAVPATPGEPMSLAAAVDLLVCSDICVPRRLDLALDLPAGPAGPSDEANLLARAVAAVPVGGEAAGLSLEGAVLTPGRAPSLSVTLRAREPLVEPDVFVEGVDLAFAAPRASFSDGNRRVVLQLPVAHAPAGKAPELAALAGRMLTLTVVDGRRAAEFQAAATVAAAPVAVDGTLGGMLALALLGGLILNLMPCVLPVLSLKLASAVGLAGAAPGRVRLGFLASAAGILASFLALAAALAGLKAAGAAVGWGIQFQQPLFLVFMTVLVTAFAANLWGLFEVPLPRGIADALGSHPGNPGSLAGNFATGALATLLATPCSAPFLGTAVGFALARGPLEILAVFAALGTGLALPYLLVAAVPGIARLLPRPGRWMVTLRRVLGVALALTGLWLLAVLAAQEGTPTAAAVGGLMIAALVLLAILRGAGRRIGTAAAAVLALLAFGAPAVLGGSSDAGRPGAAHDGAWAAFDRMAIAPLVAEGRTVFVDVTADWCITCQANKTLVLGRGEAARRLFGGEVVAMQADWTRPDPSIADYLAAHGRYGIPFNIVYGPGAPEGIALPELLSEGAVLDALDRAARAPDRSTPGRTTPGLAAIPDRE
ncbi:protein-disulfide reductase DsbD family protein [Arenibaculum pallidiluteum]|uniref:protein-disulfide reductase DsbD family protein n=1 Tax=Arenibaculum pallidiluteum TaxID=2812559 RepID=UPI001A96A295|nr:protein-disulfide reductase DsbD domain-containing protein [Arenibaculum pallidiluteum]